MYDSIPFAEPFDADKEHRHIEDTLSNAERLPIGETLGDATETAINAGASITETAFNVLDSTLDTPIPTPSIGGARPKSVEDKKRKRKRGR